MTRADIEALADRVERAAGADRGLDACIAATLRVPTKWQWASGYPSWEGREDGRVYLEAGGPSFAAAAYTESVDAAMSLVPEGYHWGVNWHAWDRDGRASVLGRHQSNPSTGYAATPALALVAACLRAHAATKEQP